jgi:hypothetical protein
MSNPPGSPPSRGSLESGSIESLFGSHVVQQRASQVHRASGLSVPATVRIPSKSSATSTTSSPAPGQQTLTEHLQRQAKSGGEPADNAEQAVASANASAGTSPDAAVTARVAQTTGADLSGVRVHTGSDAAAAAEAVNARAYTLGQGIYFGAGQYQPAIPDGQQLLAHELVHTVQQQGGATRQNKSEDTTPGDAAEREADHIAERALANQPAGPVRERATGIAHAPANPSSGPTPTGPAPANPFPVERAFTRQTREVISNAPSGMEAWNGTYQWDSKMHLAIEPGKLTVTVRIFTSANETTRTKWADAIADKWSGKEALVVTQGTHPGRYTIIVSAQWVTREQDADYTVTPNAPSGPTAGGRMGLGGTTSKTTWGTADNTDVTHEFGHMLGNPEDYFTTNGVDYTHGGTTQGFREQRGGIMNNPTEMPFQRHYETIKNNAAEMLGVPASSCSIASAAGNFVRPSRLAQSPGDFPTSTGDQAVV